MNGVNDMGLGDLVEPRHINPMNEGCQTKIFDQSLVLRHRLRATAAFKQNAVVHEEAARHLCERLQDVKKTFVSALNVGERCGLVSQAIAVAGIDQTLVETDLPYEKGLSYPKQSFDLLIDQMNFHWINDLPGALAQIMRVLRPGGLFLGAMLGGETLAELRQVFLEAEESVAGRVCPHVSPMVDLRTASVLLQCAGFDLPVADRERVTLVYPDLWALMRDLRGMGETNALFERQKTPLRRAIFQKAASLYQTRFPADRGGIRATFDLLFLHGWRGAN